MHMRYWSILFVLLLAAAEPVLAGGGAWNRKKGGYYIKIGLASLTAEEGFGFGGDRRPLFLDTANFRGGDFGVTDITLYGEFGITDWLTGVASTQYKVAVREGLYRPTGRDSTASASGLGDVWLTARMKLLPDDEQTVATLSLGWKLPTGSPLQDIPLGTGVVDYEAALAVGSGFRIVGDMYGYGQLSGGYRLRNSASNEVNFLAEIGVNLSKVLLLQGVLDGSYSTADFSPVIDDPENPDLIKTFQNDQSFSRWMIGVIYAAAEDMEINFGYEQYAAGRNIIAGSGITIGIAWKK